MAARCPICKKPVDEPGEGRIPDDPFFPFCSERCKLIDLGRWLDGKYQIPAAPDDLDESAGSGSDAHET